MTDTAFPEGWRRCDEDLYIEYRLKPDGRIDVSANKDSVSIGCGHDVYQMSLKELDNLMAILDRARVQHLHLKYHPDGPPLEEDEEWRPA